MQTQQSHYLSRLGNINYAITCVTSHREPGGIFGIWKETNRSLVAEGPEHEMLDRMEDLVPGYMWKHAVAQRRLEERNELTWPIDDNDWE